MSPSIIVQSEFVEIFLKSLYISSISIGLFSFSAAIRGSLFVLNKYVKKLLPHLDVLRRNRELIRLRTELPDGLMGDAPPERKAANWDEIRAVCEENQFKSLLKELPPVKADIPKKQEFVISGDDDDLFAFAAGCMTEKEVKTVADDEEKEIQGELF